MLATKLDQTLLGCTTYAEAIEAMCILELMRQEEGISIVLFNDNPDFNLGPNAAIEVSWDFAEMPTRFSGETVLECLRAAHEAHKARANG